MPGLRQQRPVNTAERAADRELLRQLYAIAEQPSDARSGSRRRGAARRSETPYQQAISRAALVVALVLVAAIWWVGAQFTLTWLNTEVVDITAFGLAAWAVPLAISALEVGTIALRARSGWLWLLWLLIFGLDVYTTAAGLLVFAEGRTILGHTFAAASSTSWTLALVGGALIAAIPEPAARSIVREF